eukprot:1145755-Pelagomonas_calceolata.AAC.6
MIERNRGNTDAHTYLYPCFFIDASDANLILAYCPTNLHCQDSIFTTRRLDCRVLLPFGAKTVPVHDS